MNSKISHFGKEKNTGKNLASSKLLDVCLGSDNFTICFGFSQNLKKNDVSARLPGKLIVRFFWYGRGVIGLDAVNQSRNFSNLRNQLRTKSYLRRYK